MEKKNWVIRNWSFTGLYYHSCRYGESSTRPIIWLASLISVSTVYFLYLNLLSPEIQLTWDSAYYLFSSSLKRSLSAMSPFFELQNNGLSDYTLRILLLPVLGILFISLRRNLERKFRH